MEQPTSWNSILGCNKLEETAFDPLWKGTELYRTIARLNPGHPRSPNPGIADKRFSFHPTF